MPQTIVLISKNQNYIKQLELAVAGTTQDFVHYNEIENIQYIDAAIALYDTALNAINPVLQIQEKLSRKTPVISINLPIANMSMQINAPLDLNNIILLLAKFAHSQSDRPPTSIRALKLKLEDKKTNIKMWCMLQNFSELSLQAVLEHLQIRDNSYQDVDWPFVLQKLKRKNYLNIRYITTNWNSIIEMSSTKNITSLWQYLGDHIIESCQASKPNQRVKDFDILLRTSINKGLDTTKINLSPKIDPYYKILVAGLSAKYQSTYLLDSYLQQETELVINTPKKVPTFYNDTYWFKLQKMIEDLDEPIIRKKFTTFITTLFSDQATPSLPWSLISALQVEDTQNINNAILSMLQKNKTTCKNLPPQIIKWCSSSKSTLDQKYRFLDNIMYNQISPDIAHDITDILKFIATNDSVENRWNFYKQSNIPKIPYDFSSSILHNLIPEYTDKYHTFNGLMNSAHIQTEEEYLNILSQIVENTPIIPVALPEFEL